MHTPKIPIILKYKHIYARKHTRTHKLKYTSMHAKMHILIRVTTNTCCIR